MKFDVIIRAVFADEKPVKAIASVTMNDAYVIHDIRLIESDGRLFIAMPHKVYRDKDGNEIRRDVFHPIHADARKEMESAVIAAYQAKKETEAE